MLRSISPGAPRLALVGVDALDVPGYDLWMTFIKNVHVVPTLLDVGRFSNAVSETVRAFPHAAGRLRRDAGRWTIQLVDAPIPLHIARAPAGVPQLGAGAWVVQDNLTPFLNAAPGVPACDDPLLRLQLTTSAAGTETAVGVAWHHTLGDATVLLRFMRHVSQLYADFDAPRPAPPTFGNPALPAPAPEAVAALLPAMPHLQETYTAADLAAQYRARNRAVVRADWRVRVGQLRSLRAAVQARASTLRVSVQDCLTAYVAVVVGRCAGTPVLRVTNASRYRHVNASFVQPDVAGNAIFIIPSEVVAPSDAFSVPAVACAIRESIVRWCKPAALEAWMTVASHLMLTAANADKLFFFATDPFTMTVNSNLALDWCSVHFGFPGAARFFTAGVSDNYLRVFRSNPVQADGSENAQVDVCIGLSSNELKEKILDIFHSDFAHPRFPENIVM